MKLLDIIDQLVTHIYISSDPSLFPLGVFMILDWTQRYGLNDFSASSLAHSGIIFGGVLGDISGAVALGTACLKVEQKYFVERTAARSRFVVYGLVLHWKLPFQNCLKDFLEAYDIGLRTGDTESACWAIHLYVLCRFLAGTNLELMANDARIYRAQIDELDHTFIGWQTAMHHQVFLNLRGQTEDVLALHGEAFTDAEATAFRKVDKVFHATFNTWQGYVWCLYGEFEKCVQLALEYGVDAIAKRLPASVTVYPEAFSMGISCFAVARQCRRGGRRRRLRKLADQVHKTVKKWIEQGCPNVSHLDALLDAESAAFQGKKFVAKQKYEGAVAIAARSGVLLYAGFAAERFGEYLLEMEYPKDDVMFHLDRAVQYYREAGAHGKANRLEQKHVDLRPLPDQVLAPRGVIAWDGSGI